MNTETIAMTLIAHSGDARTFAFQALQYAKKNDPEKARQMMEQSGQALLEAHQAQTALLSAEADGQNPEINVLLIHAQDHLMTSMLAQEMIGEMMEMYEQFNTHDKEEEQ
ncbi:PTS lactose/cellobiose transporter subunit IIA [uncultured Dubosiella sp.]|nr:PTS lactose/cellobiose transporter subunit IIA [uncultured Dubosiella sp.]